MTVLLATLPIGVGIAVLGVTLPAFVKDHFSNSAAVTGGYVAAMSGTAALGALTVVPLADALGGWRVALALSAIPGFLALALWTDTIIASDSPRAATVGAAPRALTRKSVLLGVVFGLATLTTAAMINWIAAVYLEAGWNAGNAAYTTVTLAVLTCVAALVMPVVTTPERRGLWVCGAGLCIAVGVAGMALVPTEVPILWIGLAGAGIGAIFPLVLVLPLDLYSSPTEVAGATAVMSGIGYCLASTGPLVVGALRDATGDFLLPLLLVAGCGLASGLLALAPVLRPGHAPTDASALQQMGRGGIGP
jgi:CP family cyanate transporter-like MFS transporter